MGHQYIGFVATVLFLVLLRMYAVRQKKRETRQREEEAKRREQEAKERAENARIQRIREEQAKLLGEIVFLTDQVLESFESTPRLLSQAEEHLNQAEIDFTEGLFGPFWDSIERAVTMLGQFDEGLRRINEKSAQYAKLVDAYPVAPPPFPVSSLSVTKLDTGKHTAVRLRAIVRNAQRNFQFATIYEQRKTNQILTAGFNNFGQALDRMSSQIMASISDLSYSVDSLASSVEQSASATNSGMGEMRDVVGDLHESFAGHASEQARREKIVLERLDNIQRGRKPLI